MIDAAIAGARVGAWVAGFFFTLYVVGCALGAVAYVIGRTLQKKCKLNPNSPSA